MKIEVFLDFFRAISSGIDELDSDSCIEYLRQGTVTVPKGPRSIETADDLDISLLQKEDEIGPFFKDLCQDDNDQYICLVVDLFYSDDESKIIEGTSIIEGKNYYIRYVKDIDEEIIMNSIRMNNYYYPLIIFINKNIFNIIARARIFSIFDLIKAAKFFLILIFDQTGYVKWVPPVDT